MYHILFHQSKSLKVQALSAAHKQPVLSFHTGSFKHILYLISMIILIFLSVLILVQAPFDLSGMDFLSAVTDHLPLIILTGSFFFICCFLFIRKMLAKCSKQRLIFLTVLLSCFGIFLQYRILFHFQPVLRYDHLRVFDGALEIFHTGKLSLSANNGYFGRYPFNISIVTFHSLIFRIFQLFGISENYFMLGLQCVYLFFIDLGVLFSGKIVQLLYGIKDSVLFSILCFFNPILYVCAAGCYTTTLMVPLLMGTLLLFFLFLKEKRFYRKCFFAVLSGAVLAFGSRLRATVFIAGIALLIYLLIRNNSIKQDQLTIKKTAFMTFLFLSGCVINFGGFTALQNSYITENYKDTQMPPIYYLMFAANPDTKGTYNEEDFQMISSYDTLEEKERISFEILKERLHDLGYSGAFSLAFHKLGLTWSDGTEDYSDFFVTSRNYDKLHSFIAGDQKDFFALYCHMFHTAVLILFLISAFFMLKRKCDSPYYLLLLTLLGGIIFHIFWESYYIYSFGFSMLLLIAAVDGSRQLDSHPLLLKKTVAANCPEHQHFTLQDSPSRIFSVGCIAFTLLMLFLIPCLNKLRSIPYNHVNYAVVQDMCIGENKPLLTGDCITQTFQSQRPFNEISCKIFNATGTENQSMYRFELLSSDGRLIFQTDFYGSQIPDKNYCSFKTGSIIPNGTETYTIRISPFYTSEKYFLTFGYYATGNYDIYTAGSMSGLDTVKNADLTFKVFESVETNFYQ